MKNLTNHIGTCFIVLISLLSSVSVHSFERYEEIDSAGASVSIMFDSKALWLKRKPILAWVKHSTEVVAAYYGRFPVESVNIALIGVTNDVVESGWVIGAGNPVINVRIGTNVNDQALKSDWVLVHEMIHLAFPDVKQRWIEEGIATYIESVSRVHAGDLTPDYVWSGFSKSMPLGQPRRGDNGLDHTPSWGRTYWGGAAFSLVADVQIRQHTNNRLGLRDALKSILNAGYNMNRRASLPEVLEVADKAIGKPILMALYERHKDSKTAFDLDGVWKDLGLKREGDVVTYQADAPWSSVRKAILTR